ncbi:MAG: hypothetical protein NTZ46_03300 [Verrucomicrobia bacterium]|nr:hypothetical protein [Verrucomicrobiota bacterium]
MKLSKEQIQKGVLVTMLSVGGLYYYTFEMLKPLAKREAAALAEITALGPKIKEAKSKIVRINAIQAGDENAAEAQRVYALMKAKIPDGQPVAWIPTRFAEFFKKQGVGKPIFRCNPEPTDADFPGYKLSSWTVDLPSVGIALFGEALAGLENQEGLMQITSLQIDSVAADPRIRHAQFTISTLVKK